MSRPPDSNEGWRLEQRPDPAQPAGTDLLPDIRHIVVLMMENHSYDAYLGMLEGRGDVLALGPDGHASVLKLVDEKWNLPPLTRRDATAATPLGALDLASPPAFLNPPALPTPSLAWGTW